MVEVFKTNVHERDDADMLISRIHHVFEKYNANFDLTDCDKILRIECLSGIVEPCSLIALVASHGFHAEVLPDDVPLKVMGLAQYFYGLG